MYPGANSIKNAFTLVEIVVSLALILIILTSMITFFNFQMNSYNTLYNSTIAIDNLRFFSVILEKQILNSEKIFVVNNKYYFKDLESPNYYNYYTHSKNIIYKNKTDQYLNSIGYGSTSQILSDINEFKIEIVDGKFILFELEASSSEKDYKLSKEIKYHGQIIIINN
ncbi:MAG: PilW family protein [Eubacteriaceae bacterium]